ncbi:aldo/keto reductase [Phyllobacterium myrsinacearum]|uniref:Aryl-alcohol dehydrogenase-like predicted oxidoreductase n=1 Tax=Phyllobacterium myrsinacearum TaxID=28101 RepID=A0A839EKG5_9HYPH|nr:aldo/keto reductase [Phyllobacterium myrsinacearum]MBA8880521.1 aryl-alcohol dehydrogenase-like predicted oxidoreductase [Phyllobacterium myrsinacearum]
MRYRVFGSHTGLQVSELSLGTGNFGTGWGYGSTRDVAKQVFDGYAEAGGNFIDTADVYQFGEAETLLSEFIAPKRDNLVIATKYTQGSTANPTVQGVGNSRKSMIQSVEASLKRLKTDRIDLLWAHIADSVTPVEEIMRGFEDLTRSGKIIYAGFSNFAAWRIASAATLAALRGWTPVVGLQTEYSLVERSADRDLLPMAQAFGLGTVGWSPLGGGLLTGKYRKGEAGRATGLGAVIQYEDTAQRTSIVDTVLAIAAETGASPGQVGIAWVASKGVLPIIGPKNLDQLKDNLEAANVALSPNQIERLDTVSAIPLGAPHDMVTSQRTRTRLAGGKPHLVDVSAASVI